MKKFLSILIALTVVTLTGVACADTSAVPTASWRYKMTVTVETPEGLKTGSAAREVIIPSGLNRIYPKVKGEAVVVDLGKRGVLFALMRGPLSGPDYGYHVVFDVFPSPNPPLTPEGVNYYKTLKSAKAVLTPEQYPMFVRFKDINNPKTVENVLDFERIGDGYPIHYRIKADHTEEMFGQGVKIKQVTLEMTDEPVTWGIEKWISWLPSVKMSYLDGSHHSRNSPLGLDGGAFQRGDK